MFSNTYCLWINVNTILPTSHSLQRAPAAGQDFCAGYPDLKILPNPLGTAHVSIGTGRIKQGTNLSSTEQWWKSQIQRMCKELHHSSLPESTDPHSHVLVLPHMGQGLEDAAGVPKGWLSLCRAPLHGSVWDRKQQSCFRMFCTVWIPARDSHFTHSLCKQQPCCGRVHPCCLTMMQMMWQRTASPQRNTASRLSSGKLGLIKACLHVLILTQSLSKAWQQRPPQSSHFTHRDLITWNSQYILKGSLPLIIP